MNPAGRFFCLLAAVAPALLVACSGSSSTSAPALDAGTTDAPAANPDVASMPDASDASADDAAPADAGFVAAAHAPLPQIPYNGGPLIAAVELITITWSGDPLESQLQAFDAWLPASSYFKGTLAEYNIGAGTQGATWSITTAPPATLDDSQIAPLLSAAIASGAIPPPTGSRLYNLYLPPQTTVTQTVGSQVYTGCQDFQAYHSIATDGSGLVYAVNPRCHGTGFTDLDYLTLASSHEVAEAVTDPLGTGWTIDDQAVYSIYGSEIGDLCEGHPLKEDGHTVTALYSNVAAGKDARPCVPAPPGPMFGATPAPQTLTGSIGAKVSSTVTVYSTAPLGAPLTVFVYAEGAGVVVTGAPATANNADVFTLSIDLAKATAGFSRIYLGFASSDYETNVPLALTVQ